MQSIRKLKPVEEVKQEFDHLFSVRQKKARPNELKQLFLLSNDFVTYGDIPAPVKLQHTEHVKKYLAEHKELHPVNLMVGDGHYLSFAMSDVPGDIIILDNKKELLQHIDSIHQFLLEQYQEYLSGDITFKQLKSQYFHVIDVEYPTFSMFLDQRMCLMPYHWLYSEENYQRAMASFAKRQLLTININLFDLQESYALAHLLKKNNCLVTYVNLTNLPDYDTNDVLFAFIKALPVAMDKKACLYQWNVHDDGVFQGVYDHYLQFTNDCDEYENFFSEKLPVYFAKKDLYQILTGNLEAKGVWNALEKFELHHLFKSYEAYQGLEIHAIKHKKFRDKYFNELEKIQEEVKGRGLMLEKTSFHKSLSFLNKLELQLGSSQFFHIEKSHWQTLLIIYQYFKKASVTMSPHLIYFLKLDKTLAEAVRKSCKGVCKEMLIKQIELTCVSHILTEKSIRQPAFDYLQAVMGTESFDLFKQKLASGFHAEPVLYLSQALGPLFKTKPIKPKQMFFATQEAVEREVLEQMPCLIL